MLRLFRNLVFLCWLCGSLAASSIGIAIWAIGLTSQVASMTAAAAATAVRHRKNIARAVARERARGRLKRMIAMAPFAGVAAGAWFETREYQDWLKENPGGDEQEYGCHVLEVSYEVLDEFMADLPETFRPERGAIEQYLPSCERT